MVVTPRLGIKVRLLEGGLVAGVGRVVSVEGLTSQEGCSCLVVRNFGKSGSRERRLKQVDLEEFGDFACDGGADSVRPVGAVLEGDWQAGLEAQLRRV